MQPVTQEDFDKQIKKMEGYASSGQPERCYVAFTKAKKIAKRLGKNLSEHGYSDETIKSMGVEALTNGAKRQMKFAKLFAAKGNIKDFEIRVSIAESYVERLETTLPEIGYPDTAVKAMRVEANKNLAPIQFKNVQAFAAARDVFSFKDSLRGLQFTADQVGVPVHVLIGPENTAEAQELGKSLGIKTVNELLDLEPHVGIVKRSGQWLKTKLGFDGKPNTRPSSGPNFHA